MPNIKSMNCPDSEQLILFNDGKLVNAKKAAISSHLETCEKCKSNLQVLKKLDEFLFMEANKIMSDTFNDLKTKECITDDLLYRYIDGNVTAAEAAAIEQHLNSCPVCFNDMASVVKNSHTPITDFEQSELAKIRTITPDEQVSKILDYCGQYTRQPATRKKIEITTTIKNRIKEFFRQWIYTRYIWRPAIVFSVLFLLIAGIRSIARYYNSDYQVARAENILLNNYRIHIEDARLSGGYGSTGISMLMGPEEEKSDYIEQAKTKLDAVVKKDVESLTAKRLLAQIFIIEKLNAKADSAFIAIGDTVYTSAALLNDRGVLYFHQRDWKKAAFHFQSALEINKDFLEAYYNLALVKMKLGEWDVANAILDKYIALEIKDEWKRAAQHLKSEIQEKKLN